MSRSTPPIGWAAGSEVGRWIQRKRQVYITPTAMPTTSSRGCSPTGSLARSCLKAQLSLRLRLVLNDVPDRVRRYSRPRKGAIEEHARQTLEHNRGLLRELLLDGHLVRERIIDRRRLAEVLSGRATRIAPGPGELLEYAGIEAWLRRWAERPRRGGLSAPSISMAEG